jgi:hypothetical protein
MIEYHDFGRKNKIEFRQARIFRILIRYFLNIPDRIVSNITDGSAAEYIMHGPLFSVPDEFFQNIEWIAGAFYRSVFQYDAAIPFASLEYHARPAADKRIPAALFSVFH